jgi:5-methylthioadenosine/S-adenosylhomocysteine deaminase
MKAGIRVGIGTDGAVSNDHIDMFEEMRQTIFAQRYKKVSIDAETVIKMATIGGASALGLEQKIGTLTPGKQADLCIISLDHRIPQPDPYSTLVYSSSASDVIFTMVAGEPFYESGQWLSNDVPAIKQRVMDSRRSLIR